ncbi:MAG: glycosyltransferase family 39 protein [Planctomycetes bacterium]|nr:glycosyltransferase family 39 protein [Planctomycetota bacterium]MBI3836083.1 glycosyltransferase family 39 protein [Planctomycetota bacterium]
MSNFTEVGAIGGVHRGSARLMPVWAHTWLAALLVFTVAVRALDPTGWLGSDDAAYHSAAEQVLTGSTIERLHHHYSRMSMILPIVASIRIFGNGPFAVILPTYLASIACVVAVVALGRAIWGWWEGLLAATVVSVLPYFRILSTTAYPDVHACLWSTIEFLLAYLALHASTRNRRNVLMISSGFALGLAITSKEFTIASSAGVFMLILRETTLNRIRVALLGQYALGVAMFLLLEGIFYSYAAHDFLFPLHAVLKSQAGVPGMAPPNMAANGALLSIIRDRLSIFFYPLTSGWGWIGIAFLPVVGLAILRKGKMRALGAWALATFVLVAFVPVSFKDGAQPYPVFHGRHILSACVPFSLCAARILNRSCVALLQDSTLHKFWFVPASAAVAMSLTPASGLKKFRDRQTAHVCEAANMAISHTVLDKTSPIFVTPSVYWRCRVALPEEVQSRLRVAADESSPNWWRQTTGEINSRLEKLLPPSQAYLMATPKELLGEAEAWEYGVRLPMKELKMWWWNAHVLADVVSKGDSGWWAHASSSGFDHHGAIVLLGKRMGWASDPAECEMQQQSSPRKQASNCAQQNQRLNLGY